MTPGIVGMNTDQYKSLEMVLVVNVQTITKNPSRRRMRRRRDGKPSRQPIMTSQGRRYDWLKRKAGHVAIGSKRKTN